MPQTWNHGISDEILDGIFAEEDTKNGRERKQKLERKAVFKMLVPKTSLNKGK